MGKIGQKQWRIVGKCGKLYSKVGKSGQASKCRPKAPKSGQEHSKAANKGKMAQGVQKKAIVAKSGKSV